MALELSKTPLEERISHVDNTTLSSLINSLTKREIKKCKSPYYKYDLINRIINYFETRKIPFGEHDPDNTRRYLKSINKEPLKPVEKGTRIKGIAREFITQLDDFEKIYFFAGVDKIKTPMIPLRDSALDISLMWPYEIASVYIRGGIDHMQYMHNSIYDGHKQKRLVKRGRRTETYMGLWRGPHSDKIRERLLSLDEIKKRIETRNEELISEFKGLFSEEDKYKAAQPCLFINAPEETDRKLYEINERISIKLDSLNLPLLRLIGLVCGNEKLGGYARLI